MKDPFIMSCNCQDGSFVKYTIEDWVRMVYHYKTDWTKWKAQYNNGKWEYTF